MPLLLQPCFDPRLVADAQSDQFLIALHQMGHTTLSNADATCQEGLMHFGYTAVFPKAPPSDQGNHLSAKLAMGQGPAPFFLRMAALMKPWTTRLDTVTHHQGQFPQGRRAWSRSDDDDRPPRVADHTAHSALATGSTSSHASLRDAGFVGPSSCSLLGLSPSFFFPAYTPCQPRFAIQRKKTISSRI